MPIGPNQIKQFREDKVEAVIEAIDSELRHPRILERGMGSFPHYYLHLVVPGSLFTKEKKFIEEEYKKSGWFSVKASNSEDNGERPGLIGVLLFATETAYVQHRMRDQHLTQAEVEFELKERKRMDALEASREASQGGIDD